MPQWDRITRALFVSAAVGLGWGIRGTFGHQIGASYPGACLALALCYVSGQEALRKWMPILAAVTGILIGYGGSMSYGILHGYAQSDTAINYTYGLFTLFLQGGAWGVFGCAAFGLLLERERPGPREWLVLPMAVIVSGVLFQLVLVNGMGLHVNPPRSDSLIAFTGSTIALFVTLYVFKRRLALYAAALGFFGFGLGMCGGRVLGNISNVLQAGALGPFTINHWNVMELSVGLIAGFIFAYGMLGWDFPDPPDHHPVFAPLSGVAMAYVVFGIPLLHRLTRITDNRIKDWIQALSAFDLAPEKTVHSMQLNLTGLCLLALVGAVASIVLYVKYEQQWPWLPVIALSGVMLLFQNVFAMYFITPRQPGQVDTQTFYWVLFLFMVTYVIVQSLQSGPEDSSEGIDDATEFNTWMVPILCVASFLLCVAVTSKVNGEQTMKTAETRWPHWSWRDGPFPGTQTRPTQE